MTGKFAIVTGASTGIGLELARCCAKDGYDLLIAADEAAIEDAASVLRQERGAANIQAIKADLATTEGVDRLVAAAAGRPVDVLVANAGRGLGDAFLDQDLGKIRNVIDTNVLGTTYLLHKVVREMRNANEGRVLITGSIAGFTPGSFQAVYNASKAYLNSLSFALREELSDTNVTVSCLMPGATETEFFRRAGMLDTKLGSEEKDDAAMVARSGYKAMLNGESDVVTGLAWSVAFAQVEEIDTINIYWAGILAMRRAVEGLGVTPQHLLIDAKRLKEIAIPQQAIVKGDAKSASIAAASILAKVSRDALMRTLDTRHPGYGFADHKGYPVRAHHDALSRLGACAAHRRPFGPVREVLGLPPLPPWPPASERGGGLSGAWRRRNSL